jgi:threonine synthase
MKYHSTRSLLEEKTFDQVLVSAYAEDGGLYVPVELPQLTMELLASWKEFSFPQVCAEVLHFFTDIDVKDLTIMAKNAFSLFNDGDDPLPLNRYGELLLLDTSLGPTLAFKDIGQQMCGQLLNYVLGKQNKTANIIIETSGDTGPAAIAGVRGCASVNIFCLYPYQRVSDVQELQMTTVRDSNVFVYRTEGTSDLQASVLKDIFADKRFVEDNNVCSVNSINWARIAAQSSYFIWVFIRLYFHGSMYGSDITDKPLIFFVPTGAFGNAMGGLLAKLMGIPIDRIVCATNANDIVHRTINSGDLQMSESVQTESPAMDIQFAYNLERMLYFVSGQDTTFTASVMTQVDKQFEFADSAQPVQLDSFILAKIQSIFSSVSVSDMDTLATMHEFYQEHNKLLCPHSAIGVFAARNSFRQYVDKSVSVCVLTAHPLKFESAVKKALGRMPIVSDKVENMKLSPQSFQWLRIPANYSEARWRQTWIDQIKSDVIRRSESRRHSL